jgi:hypothetical protein
MSARRLNLELFSAQEIVAFFVTFPSYLIILVSLNVNLKYMLLMIIHVLVVTGHVIFIFLGLLHSLSPPPGSRIVVHVL